MYIISGIITVIAVIISFTVGFLNGRKYGNAEGKVFVTQKLRLFINKVLELVPPDKYADLNTQVEYLYEQITEGDR